MQSYRARYEQGEIVLLEDAEIPEDSELIVTVLEETQEDIAVPDDQVGAETPVLKNARISLGNCQNSLQKHLDDVTASEPIDDEALKRRDDYFRWVALKTELISSEAGFVMPCDALPNKISEYTYGRLHQDKKSIVDKHYKKDGITGYFVINAKKTNVPQNEAETLIHNMVLRRGNVVWVHFGFNIGSEFRGKHPAIILKNTKDTLVVIPLSSQAPSNPDVNVEIENVHGLPQRTRWANILRIVPVSIIRIDLGSPIGDVKGRVLNEISEVIKLHGIK